MEGQYVAYTFFRVDPAWRRLPISDRQAHKDAFAEVVEDFADRLTERPGFVAKWARARGEG